MKNYYKILGVPPAATATEIKQSYRKLIKGCHPDVNKFPQAVEWSRELNEAYGVLSDAQQKMSYDMDLRLEESKQRETTSRQTTSQTTTSQPRTETRQAPRAEPNFCCEKCKRVDSSLRISATWRVHSFINYSKKSPTIKVLCSRCRVKESLAASAYTFFLGWWSIYGFFWTIEALFHNANGGEQPKENNAILLNALGYQLYRAGRPQEAYVALNAALKLKPDPHSEQLRDYLKQQIRPAEEKDFWAKFRNLELHPFYYHASVGAVVLVLLIFGFHELNADSTKGGSSTEESSSATYAANRAASYHRPDVFDAVAAQKKLDLRPVFSELEQPLPDQGALSFSADFAQFNGTTAPFKITTPSDGNYVMKVEDWNTKECVAQYLIRRSSTLSIELPLGSYKLKFAVGDKWYGMKFLFGPTTSYSYVPDKMDFYISGDYARGHSIELIPQVNGNLETPPMKATDW